MREIIINGTNYNKHVESVTFHSNLGEGSRVELNCNPGMPEIAAYSPITVKMNGEVVFKGYVGAPEFTVLQYIHDGSGHVQFAKYECYDDGAGFKNALITGEFVGTPEQVMTQIVNLHKGEYPQLNNYTFHFQSTIDVNLAVAYTYTEFNTVCDQIAAQMSGYWFVAPDNKVYFFQDSISDVTGTTRTIQYSNVQTPYTHRKATDEVVNMVTILGGEAETQRNYKWIYDGVKKEWTFPEPPLDVTVTIDGEPAFLIPNGFSGDPYNASDRDAANTYDYKSDGDANTQAYTHVVVHHIAAKNATKAQIYDWHTDPPPDGNGWSDIGYHWYVHKDGTVEACRPESKIGAHAKGHNSYTVGVACEGDYERFDTSMPQAQFKALTALILDIMSEYNMPKTNLLYHGEICNTDCPGKYFPKQALRDAVRSGSSTYQYVPTTSVAGADSTRRLIYNTSDGKLAIDPQYPPVQGAVIDITFTTAYFVSATEKDVASIQQYGRIIPYVEVSEGATTKEQAIALAKAILRQRKSITETVSLSLVFYQQLFGGEKVYLPWLDRYGLIMSTEGELNYNNVEWNRMKVEVKLI